MNLEKLFMVALILGAGISATGQVPSEAILVNEIALTPCDNFRGEIDIFISDLRENPGFAGWVVNGGDESDKVLISLREDMIRNHLVFRKFDLKRVKFARTPARSIKTQFWRTPLGESPPVAMEVGNEFTLPSTGRPLRIISDYEIDDLCPPTRF